MPFTWTIPPLPPAFPVQEQVQKKPGLSDFGDEVVVTGHVREWDTVRNIVYYSEGVAARFGPTLLTADRMEIHGADEDKYVIARGNVNVEDPEGRFKAYSIVFWYGKDKKGPDGQIAVADRVEVEIGGVTAFAESAVLREGRWEFLNVQATNCKRPVPLYLLKSKRVVLNPGKSGTLYSPRLEILGKDIGTLPTRHFSLDRRSPGLQIPALNYKKGAGLGVSWTSGFLLDDQSLFQADLSSFPKEYPSYSATYARSFIPGDLSNSKITARSDLNERFSWSYFDNIRVGSIESTRSVSTKLRNSITVQSIWNTGSSARLEGEDFSKALDVTYERSGLMGPFGLFLQARGQSIRERGNPFVERGLLSATLQAPPIVLAKGLETDFRVDMLGIAGEHNRFGWVRGQAGVIFKPIPQLTLGAAYISAEESGTPDFTADRLVSTKAAHFRADINLGPTKIGYLAKYDFNRKQWYDKEYSISQVIGCLEPFLIRREFPSDYALGVRFRLDDFFSILERRKQVRTKPVPAEKQTISSLPPSP